MPERKNIVIKEVLADSGLILGVEIDVGGKKYFIAKNQGRWPNVRAGKFPCKQDGGEFERVVVEKYEIYAKA